MTGIRLTDTLYSYPRRLDGSSPTGTVQSGKPRGLGGRAPDCSLTTGLETHSSDVFLVAMFACLVQFGGALLLAFVLTLFEPILGREVSETCVKSALVVMFDPNPNDVFGLQLISKLFVGEAFLTQRAMEPLHFSIRLRVMDPNTDPLK